MEIHDELENGFGMKSNAYSFLSVAASPYQVLSRLTMNLR